MPSAVFPRNSLWLPIGVSGMSVPASRRQITKAGIVQTRGATTVGRTWREDYPPLFARDPDVEGFLAWLNWAWNTGAEFSIQHPMKPGSGSPPNGVGGGTPLVSGGAEVGSTINIDGWPSSTSNVVAAGDLIKISGIQHTFEVTDNADSDGGGNAVVGINPPIYVGGSPGDNSPVTRSDVNMTAIIMEANIPDVANGFWYTGLSVTFREAP